MIVFDLKCTLGHQFEAWFRSSEDYEEQLALEEIECPHCGDTNLGKALMAPNIGAKGNQEASRPAVPSHSTFDDVGSLGLTTLPDGLRAELKKTLDKVRKHVEDNCEYVGDRFPEEARKIHYGETEDRGIYGEATIEESVDLMDEGIDVFALPPGRKAGPTDA